MNRLQRLCWLGLMLLSLPFNSALADQDSYGVIAGRLFGDALVIRGIVQAICIATGAGLIFGSLIQYMKYRRNPVEVTISTPIMSLICGVALIGLSFIPLVA